MIYLRSILFNIVFYSWTMILAVICLPFLLFPFRVILQLAIFWSRGSLWLCETILDLKLTIKGRDRFPKEPSILAVKHQSAWETIVFYSLFSNVSIVLKRELLLIPFFGWYLKRLNMVPLSRVRGNGVRDLKNLLYAADCALKRKQSILIFPEGTRSQVGQKSTYHSGVASLYTHLNIPVIPIALNSGLFWPRRGFIKRSGCISLELLEPIQPGLSRQEFMKVLEDRIETKTNDLIREGLAYETQC
jgi:1-acyl-sn-glycerol-3-phosphate acyltransferase